MKRTIYDDQDIKFSITKITKEKMIYGRTIISVKVLDSDISFAITIEHKDSNDKELIRGILLRKYQNIISSPISGIKTGDII